MEVLGTEIGLCGILPHRGILPQIYPNAKLVNYVAHNVEIFLSNRSKQHIFCDYGGTVNCLNCFMWSDVQ